MSIVNIIVMAAIAKNPTTLRPLPHGPVILHSKRNKSPRISRQGYNFYTPKSKNIIQITRDLLISS